MKEGTGTRRSLSFPLRLRAAVSRYFMAQGCLPDGATSPKEVPQDRNDREDQEEVDQSPSHIEKGEPKEPGHDQNDGDG